MNSLEYTDTSDSPTSDEMIQLEEEFAKYLITTREKGNEPNEGTKQSFMQKLANIKQNVKQKFDQMMAIKDLKAQELEALRQFIDKVREDRKKPPVPMCRPEGLELNLLGVALFSGNEIFSKAIRYVTKSTYSHVALLLHDITKDPLDPDGWYIYSANGSASQIMERQLPQVQLEKWSETINGYDGTVSIRLMNFNDGAAPTTQLVTELVDKWMGMPYEKQVLIMVRAMTRTNVAEEGTTDSAFCSEICYRFLAAAGILDDNEVAENVWPKDFTDESERLRLLTATWAEIKVIKGNNVVETVATVAAVESDPYVCEVQSISWKQSL